MAGGACQSHPRARRPLCLFGQWRRRRHAGLLRVLAVSGGTTRNAHRRLRSAASRGGPRPSGCLRGGT
eukprot:14008369-Alexandrium_andersonii.AAC.1